MTAALTTPWSVSYDDSWPGDKDVEPIGETFCAGGIDSESSSRS